MARLSTRRYEVEARASVKSANKSYVIDPKPSDLSMVRMKLEIPRASYYSGYYLVNLPSYTRLSLSLVWRGTWGTETSKYPQEKKENSIPRVVASEIGRA